LLVIFPSQFIAAALQRRHRHVGQHRHRLDPENPGQHAGRGGGVHRLSQLPPGQQLGVDRRDLRQHGWECSTSKHTDFVEAAIRQAVAYRRRQGRPLGAGAIHHSDAGSQYTAVHFGQTLFLEGLTPSIGSVGDAYDNALAETTIGLYKTECVRDGSPFRRGPIHTLVDLEEITSAWVHWYNTRRLMHRLGRIPPAEAETAYYAATDAATPAASHTN
jgi:transposase InsO family protein